jgi:hypothetical protein
VQCSAVQRLTSDAHVVEAHYSAAGEQDVQGGDDPHGHVLGVQAETETETRSSAVCALVRVRISRGAQLE